MAYPSANGQPTVSIIDAPAHRCPHLHAAFVHARLGCSIVTGGSWAGALGGHHSSVPILVHIHNIAHAVCGAHGLLSSLLLLLLPLFFS